MCITPMRWVDQRLRADMAARARHDHPIEVLIPFPWPTRATHGVGCRGLEHEEDEEGDGEAEEAGRFGEREAQERERRHLRRGIARERVDERREHVADTDTGTDERDTGKAGNRSFWQQRDP